MTSKTLCNELRRYCISNANEDNIIKSQRYFKETYKGYGLSAAQIYPKVKEILSENKLDLSIILESIPILIRKGMYDEIVIGLLLLNGLSKEFTFETLKQIENFYAIGIDNWAHADAFGVYILPKFLARKIVAPEYFSQWINSPYKFQRRCIPVTYIKSIKASKECRPFINLVEPLMNDKEREVHQGVGWFLREAWKIQRKETEEFLLKWKETAPRLIMQYACEKMTPDEKVKYKRTRIIKS
jgi:3-methyladenine DNA glycosylase AlkD